MKEVILKYSFDTDFLFLVGPLELSFESFNSVCWFYEVKVKGKNFVINFYSVCRKIYEVWNILANICYRKKVSSPVRDK
jgi:hypothetical protein